jgi:uridine monophosphate synthetase
MKKIVLYNLFLLMLVFNYQNILLGNQNYRDETNYTILKNKRLLEDVVLELFDIGAIQFGSFKLKTGRTSSYYIDLRRAISHPKLLSQMADLMWEKIESIDCNSICGVPYAAIALSTSMSINYNKPMLMIRKERKEHGTKHLIEGIFQKDDKVIIVEDVITSGSSLANTSRELIQEGLIVKNSVVFLDRQQGGCKHLASHNIQVHSVLTISEVFSILTRYGRINQSPPKLEKQLSYKERAKIITHPLAKKLLILMEEKQTNLAASADMTNKELLLDFADKVGPYICVLKTHIDIIEDFDEKFINDLKDLAKKHQFLIFEDRKFADIGNTVIKQYQGGIYKISSWSNLINAHTMPGPGLITALKKVAITDNSALLLIPQMSSYEAFNNDLYIKKTIDLANENIDFVIGFISRKRLNNDLNFIYLTPGINLSTEQDKFGQQYLTPFEAIARNGSDIIIVGRGLYEAADFQSAAKQYRKAGWDAYLQRLKN